MEYDQDDARRLAAELVKTRSAHRGKRPRPATFENSTKKHGGEVVHRIGVFTTGGNGVLVGDILCYPDSGKARIAPDAGVSWLARSHRSRSQGGRA